MIDLDAVSRRADVAGANLFPVDGGPVTWDQLYERTRLRVQVVREDVPALVAEVRRLQQEVEEWKMGSAVEAHEADAARAEVRRLRGLLKDVLDGGNELIQVSGRVGISWDQVDELIDPLREEAK